MFRFKNRVLPVLALAATLSAPSAFALPGLDIGLMAGPNLYTPNLTSVPGVLEYSGGIGFSAGPSVSAGPLEVSALYTKLKLKTKTTLLSVTSEATGSFDSLEIPALFRLGVGPLGLGLGGFYSLSLEDNGASNYGATASFRVTIPFVGLFADARYNLGLKDISGQKLSHAAVLLGLNFL